MEELEEDALNRWTLNQLEDIKHRAEQIIQPSRNKTLGDTLITGFELMKLLIESQCVCERYRFMRRLQEMKGDKIE